MRVFISIVSNLLAFGKVFSIWLTPGMVRFSLFTSLSNCLPHLILNSFNLAPTVQVKESRAITGDNDS